MLKKLTLIFLLAVGLSACKKNNNGSGCGIKTCTAEYVSFGIIYTDSQDRTITVKDVTVINLRTKKPVTPPPYPPLSITSPTFNSSHQTVIRMSFRAPGMTCRLPQLTPLRVK